MKWLEKSFVFATDNQNVTTDIRSIENIHAIASARRKIHYQMRQNLNFKSY